MTAVVMNTHSTENRQETFFSTTIDSLDISLFAMVVSSLDKTLE
jgi:hypothetical protein